MSIRTCVRLGFVLLAACFVADGSYALYRGDAVNSAGIVLDATAILFCTLGALIVPLFFGNGSNEVTPTPRPPVKPDAKVCNCCNMYETVDAVRLLMSLECISDDQRDVLGDIAKCVIIKGECSCEA